MTEPAAKATPKLSEPDLRFSSGLVPGRIVEYVTRMGETRAATVAHVHATPDTYVACGAVNLTVYERDGSTYGEAEVPFEGRSLPGGPRIHFWRWPKRVGA